ncbi:DUF4127 family protein [Oceanobacillus damuensis]|uniref:DUF4127 family protein n=1 Tax=Oceanobacillus damuensis TaxID=937928 RepID=UPI00082AE97C|nr:DUF4127 family protein [Oceanobacillus damuensis]
MKIIYIPIDERPCNTHVVERIAATAEDIDLLLPSKNLFGFKKNPADTEGIWQWIKHEASEADALILSVDMLVYGGLLPSRMHYLLEETADKWIERLRDFHQEYPDLPIYASNMIMRTPKYSSSDEEPMYYEEWGREIFLHAYLEDKQNVNGLTDDEAAELKAIQQKLPKQYVEDYEKRRSFNIKVNQSVLELVQEGVINFLAIPQDDSSEYGYTARDQSVVVAKREQLRLYNNVHIYPGADEVGATLLARIYNTLHQKRPRIYTFWSSTFGPQIIPMYEDRPFAESLKAHVLASGCQLVDRAEEADIILAYNTPGRLMQEAWDQSKKDITYSSFRNLLHFVDQIASYVKQGKKVIVADSAYANGGDSQLITLLDEAGILDKLLSYKGWNTNCNTLGTTIAQGVMGMDGEQAVIQQNLIYHLLDDYFYQTEIRMEMLEDFVVKHGLSYFDLKDKANLVNEERDKRLRRRYSELIMNSFKGFEIEKIQTYAPWNRMFECGIELKTKTI